jgi:hypothetical protein
MSRFHYFFDCCIGGWSTERTYHYLDHQQVERSHTQFLIRTLTPALQAKVLQDNHYSDHGVIDGLLGFHLAFETRSETGQEEGHELNMLFIPQQETEQLITGDYLRDRAYEEDRPMVSPFRFDPNKLELLMTTTYTHVVSVDVIRLMTPRLRIRQIINYRRPAEGQPLQEILLVGFGVEQKTT